MTTKINKEQKQLKEDLALLKRLEEDCRSIQRSLAIIQSAQRILTFYTPEERERLFQEYARLNVRRRRLRDRDLDPNGAQAVFREDHPDIATVADAIKSGSPIDLSKLKLDF